MLDVGLIYQMNRTFYKAVTSLWRSMKLDIHGKIKYKSRILRSKIYLNLHNRSAHSKFCWNDGNLEELFKQSVPSPIDFLYILAFIKIISNKSL